MARILIGSSNIYRFYKPESFKGYKKQKMMACTNMETFKVAMDELEDTKGGVTISVIENFVCRATRAVNNEAKEEATREIIKEYIRLIKISATKCPKLKFAIVQPMQRPLDFWYSDNHKSVSKWIEDGIKDMDLGNVTKIEGLAEKAQVFDKDGVHLTGTSGKAFIDAILFHAEEFFLADFIDLEMETEGTKTAEKEGKNNSKTSLDKRMSTLEREVGKIKEDLKEKRFHDSMVTARIREELDWIINEKKEDRIVLTGLTNRTTMPTGLEAKKKWVNEMVGGILDSIVPEASKHFLFANQGRSRGRDVTLVEVRMESKEMAFKIRKQFAEKKKAGVDFGRLFLSNSVTLATRVRIDILKAIAKKYSSEKEDLYVTAFTSRPVLQVKRKMN